MKLETFFEKFELLADAPGAVEKMRELLLALAVTGQLVEQELADGDADTLLAAIATVRKKRDPREPTRVTEEQGHSSIEGWHRVPASWRWVRLGTVGTIVGGGTPRSERAEYFAEEGIPWLTPADLNGFKGKRISRGRRFITKLGLENSSARLLPEGSVLFSSRAPIGYVAIAGSDLATNQGFKSCVPYVQETSEFLYYYLRSASARIDREASGTTFREVSGKIVSQIPVPLPPLAEQKRIVAKVDELMALCDQLEAQQQEREARHATLARASLARFAEAPTPANLCFLFHKSYDIDPAELRKAILNLASKGELVRKEPDEGETQRVTMEELVGRKNLKNGLSLPTIESRSDFVCLPLSAMKGAIVDCSFGKPIAINAERAAPYLVKPSEIFIIRGNGSKERVGIAGMVRTTPTNVIFPDLFIRVPLPLERIEGDYFLIVWNSATTREMLERLATTTSGIWKVNQGHIAECEIFLPPLAQQRRIVAKVERLMALVDELERRLSASRGAAASLLGALVAELVAA